MTIELDCKPLLARFAERLNCGSAEVHSAAAGCQNPRLSTVNRLYIDERDLSHAGRETRMTKVHQETTDDE